jgi:glycosyltransferase involved in cell wall biosynthesis
MSSEYFLLSRLYPQYDQLYKYTFVHQRILEYKKRGFAPDVFRLRLGRPASDHIFEDVLCHTLPAEALAARLSDSRYRVILIHGLDEPIWRMIEPHIAGRPVFVWVHGTEILDYRRRSYAYTTAEERGVADRQLNFWRSLLNPPLANLKLVFVSQDAARQAMRDLGLAIPAEHYAVIHNPIDVELFQFELKSESQRKHILSIRPFKAVTYGNDMIINTILRLSESPCFEDLRFTIVGDGPLFDEIVAPVRRFGNVTLINRYLLHDEIAALHRRHGIFLIPTRADTQGVSRDEAMASGLVPVTNAIDAVPEFVSSDCGILAPPDDCEALARGVQRLIDDPALFSRMSLAASQRVRAQSAADIIVPKELELITERRWTR